MEKQIEKKFVEWKVRTLETMQLMKILNGKTEDALKEKLRLQEEAKEAERLSLQQIKDLDTAKQLNRSEVGKYEVEKKLIEARLEIEKSVQFQLKKKLKLKKHSKKNYVKLKKL